MTTDLVKREQPSQALTRMSAQQLEYIATTDFVPKALRGNMHAIMACVATGRELGLGDMESMRSIHVIDGKASMSAELMVKLVRRRGHSISGEFGDGQAKVHGKRADTGDEMTVTWTRDMAVRAGLEKKDNWRKYESSMLWARAASQLCRMLFPDCLGGVSHTPDEAELTAEERVNEQIGAARPVLGDGPDDSLARTDTAEHVEGEVVHAPSIDEPAAEFHAPAEAEQDPVVRAGIEASQFVIPNGQHRGVTLAGLQDKGEKGETWLRWALANIENPAEYRDAVWSYARVFFPELYEEAAAKVLA